MRFVLVLTLAAMLASAGIAHAAVEFIAEPCRSFNLLSGRIVKAPDGVEYLVAGNMNEISNCELLFIDFRAGTGKTYRAPHGAGTWALNRVPGDRMVVGTYYDGQFMVFDLKTMAFTKSIGFPGEQYIWNLAVGGDGRVYGGSYPGAKLGALNLDTYTVEDLGSPRAEKDNTYLRNVSALPDGRILCQVGEKKPERTIFDPKTKKFEAAPASLANVSIGVAWNGYFVVAAPADDKSDPKPRFLKGGNLEAADVPFDAPEGSWTVDTYPSDEKTLYLKNGDKYLRVRAGEKKPTLLANVKPRGRVLGAAEDGTVLGFVQPDYWMIKPGASEVTYLPLPVEPSPRETHFLQVSPDGKLWGGPTFGQTIFWLDPKTKKYENTRMVCNSGGEVYDAAFANGKVYLVAYVGGDVIEYDPAQPWDQLSNKNPKVIAHLTEKGYIRPNAGVRVGPDGKLYSGWLAKYGTHGGAISITDPATGKTELIENPLGEQGVGGVATDGERIFVGSTLGANGLPNKKNESPCFGIVDPQSKQTTFKVDVKDVGAVDHLVYEPKSKLVAMTAGKTIRVFDPTKNAFTELPSLPAVAGKSELKINGDGKIYTNVEKQVLAIDPATGQSESIAEAPAEINRFAIHADGSVFCSCGTKVYRLK